MSTERKNHHHQTNININSFTSNLHTQHTSPIIINGNNHLLNSSTPHSKHFIRLSHQLSQATAPKVVSDSFLPCRPSACTKTLPCRSYPHLQDYLIRLSSLRHIKQASTTSSHPRPHYPPCLSLYPQWAVAAITAQWDEVATIAPWDEAATIAPWDVVATTEP